MKIKTLVFPEIDVTEKVEKLLLDLRFNALASMKYV